MKRLFPKRWKTTCKFAFIYMSIFNLVSFKIRFPNKWINLSQVKIWLLSFSWYLKYNYKTFKHTHSKHTCNYMKYQELSSITFRKAN